MVFTYLVRRSRSVGSEKRIFSVYEYERLTTLTCEMVDENERETMFKQWFGRVAFQMQQKYLLSAYGYDHTANTFFLFLFGAEWKGTGEVKRINMASLHFIENKGTGHTQDKNTTRYPTYENMEKKFFFLFFS